MTGAEIFAAAMALLNVVGVPIVMRLFNGMNKAKEDATAGLALAGEAKGIALDFAKELNQHKLHVAQEYLSVQAFEKVFEKFETRVMGELEAIKTDMRANRG